LVTERGLVPEEDKDEGSEDEERVGQEFHRYII
jgi:hypothetical protein